MILGSNGAGKTTTIRRLLDFLRPTRAHATVPGLDPRRDKARLHRRIGYLRGELTFPGRARADELLRFFGAARGGVAWSPCSPSWHWIQAVEPAECSTT